MSDNVPITPGTGATVAADDVGGVLYQRVKLAVGADGVAADLAPGQATMAASLPVAIANNQSTLPVAIQGTPNVTAAVSGAVSVSGSVDASGSTVAVGNTVAVSGPLTDTQLRASAVPVSAAALPLPAGAATEATLAALARAEDDAHVSGEKGIMALAVRKDADGTLAADGDYHPLVINTDGRLKVAAIPGDIAPTTGNIAANGQTVYANVARASNVVAFCTGTFSGVNCTFEASIDSTTGTDGTWFAIQAVRSNANTIELVTGALSAVPAYSWELSVNGYTYVRVRATAYTSGTQAWRFQPAPYATEPIPAAQVSGTQPVSGTVTATVTGGTVVGTAPTSSDVNSAATTNATSVKASAGTVYSIACFNAGAAAAYVKFYNKASAPTVGTDVPKFVLAVPAASHVVVEFAVQGNRFGTGIGLAITGGAADSDTTAVAAAQVKVSTQYV